MRFAVSARIAVVVAVLVLAGGNAAADTVKLNNGDRITGEIISIQEGKLILKTAYADELKIDRAVVVGITSDKDVTVWLASGDKITGKMEALEGGRVNVVTGSGAVSAAVTDVAGINAPPGGKTKSDLEAEIARLSSPSESWRGELGVGAYYTNGNSDRLGGWVRMELIRETPGDKLTAKAQYTYAEEDDEKSADEQTFSLREDVKFDPWYVFGLIEGERDDIEELDFRGAFTLGVGRVLTDTPDFKASLDLGGTLVYTDYEVGDAEWEGEARIGFMAELAVFDEAKIIQDLAIYPSVTDGGEYRFVSETVFEQPLSDSWFFRLTLLNRYNSDVPDGVEENDLELRLGLAIKF